MVHLIGYLAVRPPSLPQPLRSLTDGTVFETRALDAHIIQIQHLVVVLFSISPDAVHHCVIMAGGGDVTPAHWAVLIGINFYVGERCLSEARHLLSMWF